MPRGWFPTVMGLLAIITFGAGLYGRGATGPTFWIANGVAVLSLVLTALIPILRNARRDTAQQNAEAQVVRARADMRLAINDALAPLANELAKLAAEPPSGRRALQERVLTLAVTVAAGLVDAERARSTLYRVDDRVGRWALVPAQNAGRHDQAVTVFEEGTAAGDAVRSMIDRDGVLYCRDVVKEPPPGWIDSPERAYRTFISVAVRAGDRGVAC